MPDAVERFDVFLSWTRRGHGLTPHRLVAELRRAGLRVWFDEDDIGLFEPITAGVRLGLASSKVMIAWYSASYPTRRACREELTLALLACEGRPDGPSRVFAVTD